MRFPTSRGSALFMTLVVVAIVSVMVVAFTETIRSEVALSAPHESRLEAELFAGMGVDVAAEVLREATGDRSQLWFSAPGAVTVASGSSRTVIPLHSGAPTSYDPSAAATWSSPAELNLASFSTGEPFIAADGNGGAAAMPLRWVYVRKDGTCDFAEGPVATDKANPLIGRFAYWVDDESSRLNLNVAWKPQSSDDASNPFNVSLTQLTGMTPTLADHLRAAITPKMDFSDAPEDIRFFNDPEEIRRLKMDPADSSFDALFKSNRFEMTAKNASPDLNVFNERRIVLTTQAALAPKDAAGGVLDDANGPYFLDILTDNTKEPAITNINYVKLARVMKKIVNQLKRDDWPMASGKSFHSKYFNNDTATAQFALDIIEYVRCSEASTPLVEPIRGGYTHGAGTANSVFASNTVHNKTIRGTTRKLYITEAGYAHQTRKTSSPNLARWPIRILYELHLPEHSGIPSVDLTDIDGKRIYVFLPNIYHLTSAEAERFNDEEGTRIQGGRLIRIDPSHIDGDPILKAGEYRKIGISLFTNDLNPKNLGGRAALVLLNDAGPYAADAGVARLEVAPSWDNGFEMEPQLINENDPAMKTFQISDPVLNGVRHNWVIASKGVPQTWGKGVASTFSSVDPTTNTKQDRDKDGNPTMVGMRLPAPKGSAENPDGRVRSVAELGHVRTGIQSDASISTLKSARFRTLRLQNEGNPSELPDWALLDLFAAPSEPAPANVREFMNPGGTAVSGRVNVNTTARPFGLGAAERTPNTPQLKRVAALKGVFSGAKKDLAGTTLSQSEVDAIVNSISQKELSATGGNYGDAEDYVLPGEIAEIKRVGDQGEEGEALLKSVYELLSTRGNVFTVYSVGQALKQSPSGKVSITGEQRLKVSIERIDDGANVTIKERGAEFLKP